MKRHKYEYLVLPIATHSYSFVENINIKKKTNIIDITKRPKRRGGQEKNENGENEKEKRMITKLEIRQI